MTKHTVLIVLLLLTIQCFVACNNKDERVEVGHNGLVEIRKGISDHYLDYEKASRLLTDDKVQEAIAMYQHICTIEDDKAKTYAYMGLATAYMSAEDYQNAIVFYNKSITTDSTNIESYVGLGSAYLSLENYPKAIASYETARNKDVKNADSYWGLALTYDEMQQEDSAKANAKQFIALEPNSNYKDWANSILSK